MTSSEDDGECKTIDKPSFFEPYCQLISILLTLNVSCFFELVFEHSSMVPAKEKVEFP